MSHFQIFIVLTDYNNTFNVPFHKNYSPAGPTISRLLERQPKVLLCKCISCCAQTKHSTSSGGQRIHVKGEVWELAHKKSHFLTQKCITRAAMGEKGRGRGQQGRAAASAVKTAWRTVSHDGRRALQTPEGSVEVEEGGAQSEWKSGGRWKRFSPIPPSTLWLEWYLSPAAIGLLPEGCS